MSHSEYTSQSTTDQYTLPSTSLLISDRYQNLYLVQIDSKLTLHVVNITNYHQQNMPLEEITVDVSNTSYEMLHPDKSCNNMLMLNQTVLMVNCKSGVKGTQIGSFISSALFIDLEKIDQRQIRYFYSITALNYNQLLDGKMVLYGNYPGDVFRFIIKDNKTQCSIKIYEIKNNLMAPEVVLVIKNFHDPQFDHQQNEDNTTKISLNSHKLKIQRKSIMNLHSSLEQSIGSQCGLPEPFDYYKTQINYLNIRDVQMLGYFPDILVATDFYYGLLLWKIINCGENQYQCSYIPIYRIRIERAGALSILNPENEQGEKVIFVSQVSPPTVYEVSINSLIRSPYINRIYSVANLRYPKEDYQSFDLIDANINYIIQYLVNIKSMKPLIRVYKRNTSLYSSSYWHIQLDDFVDKGLFIKFIQYDQNFFIIRGSTYHQIFRIQPTYLEIDLWKVTPQQIMNNTKQIKSDLKINIIIQNETYSKLNASFDLSILDQNYLRVLPLQKSEDIKPIILVCGETIVISTINMEQYFSGQLSLLQIRQNETENFFQLSKTRIVFGQLKLFPSSSCEYSSVIRFQKLSFSQKDRWFISCLPIVDKELSFHSLYSNASDISIPKYQPPIDHSSTILDMIYDSSSNEYLILTKTVQGDIIMTIFKIFNIMQWANSININQKFPLLSNFKARSYDQMSYSKELRQGVIIGERDAKQQQIFIFEIGAPDTTQEEEFRIVSLFSIEVDPKIEILDVKIDQSSYLWAMLSNGTLLIYKQIKLPGTTFIKLLMRLDLKTLIDEADATTIKHFDLIGNFQTLIIFSGKNTITVFNYDTNLFNIQKSKQLTIQYTDDDSDDESQYDISFVMNNQTRKPTYSIVGNDGILFTVFEIRIGGVIIDYQFQIYDIKEPLHNCLFIRKNVTTELEKKLSDELIINPSYARIQAFKVRENPGEYFGVVLTIDSIKQATFEFRTESIVKVNPERADTFMKIACQKQMKYEFSLYSTDNPQEKLQFQVLTVNKGQIVTKEREKDNIGVEVLAKNEILWSSVSQQNRRILHNQQYSLLNNINGYNMRFNISCNQSSYNNFTQICPEAKVNLQYQSHEENLDFLSNNNQALGFFVIQNFILFFDQIGNCIVYSMTNKQYESVNNTEIFRFLKHQTTRDNGKYPKITLYKLFELEEQRFLATFNDFNQLSISKVIVTKSLKQFLEIKLKYPGILNHFQQFHQFGNYGETLLIQHAKEYANVVSEIQFLDIYKADNQDFINALIIFHDKLLQDQSSRVELYTFYFGNNNSFNASEVKLVRNFTFTALFSARLGFDFKVTCLKILQKQKIAIMGISKVGLMFYSLDNLRVLKIERLTTKFTLPVFNPSLIDILEIIPDSDSRNFQLLTYRRGILMLSYPELDPLNTQDSLFSSDPYVYEEQPQRELQAKQTLHNTLYASLPQGIIYSDVFLNSNFDAERGDKALLRLNFYGSSIYNKSRNIGTYILSNQTVTCHSLQPINAKSDIIPSHLVNSFSSVNGTVYLAVVCDATFHFIAYNFHPSLNLSISEYSSLLQKEITTHSLIIEGKNDFSSEKYQLEVTVMNSERAIHPLIAAAFALGIGVVVLVAHSLIRKQSVSATVSVYQKQNNKIINQTNKPVVQDTIKRVSTQEQWTADFKANILRSKLTVVEVPSEY